MNFPPLSKWSTLILSFNCLSTSALNSLNFLKYYPLVFNTHNHTFLEKSLINVPKYLTLPTMVSHKIMYIGVYYLPRRSDWSHPSFGNSALSRLLWIHASQIKEGVRIFFLPRFMSLIMIWNVWTCFSFQWPSRLWQSSRPLSSIGDCTKLATSAPCTFMNFIL